jgi:predicted CopG family antitoxin
MILSEEKSTKTIRITNRTYQKLVSFGKYSDSMDEIISRLLSQLQNHSPAGDLITK